MAMTNGFLRDAIEKNTRGFIERRAAIQLWNLRGGPTHLKKVKDVIPTHEVDCLLDIKI